MNPRTTFDQEMEALNKKAGPPDSTQGCTKILDNSNGRLDPRCQRRKYCRKALCREPGGIGTTIEAKVCGNGSPKSANDFLSDGIENDFGRIVQVNFLHQM